MVSIDEDIDVDAITTGVSGGVSISGGGDPGDLTINVDDGGQAGDGDEDTSQPPAGGGGRAGGVSSEDAERAGTAGALESAAGGGGRAGGVTSAGAEQIGAGAATEQATGGGGRGDNLTPGEIASAATTGAEQYQERIERQQGIERGRNSATIAVYDEETGRATGKTTEEIAKDLEQRVLRRNPWLTKEDVRVTRDGRTFQAELTEEGRLADDRASRRLGVTISSPAGGFGSTRGGTPGGEADLGDVAISGASQPFGGFESVRGGTPEGDVSRADVSTSFEWTSQPSGGFEDVRGGTTPRDDARRRRRARARTRERTPTVIRGQTSEEYRRLDAAVDQQAGMDLTPGVDYTVEERTGPGGRRTLDPQLTDAGRRRLRGDEFEREVRDVPLPNPLAAVDSDQPATFAVPLSMLPGVTEEDATLEDVTRGATRTWREGADELAETTNVINPFVIGERTIQMARERGPLGFTGADVFRDIIADPEGGEGPAEQQSEGLAAEIYSVPSYAPALLGKAEELREFGLEGVDVAEEEGFGGIRVVETEPRTVREGPGPARMAPGREIDTFDEGLAGFVAEESAETAGQMWTGFTKQLASPTGRARIAGSLIGTAGVMGGAGAVSSRAGAATRYAIQPGEELLSAGATRVAPRVAARFPGGRIDWEEPVVYGAARGAQRAAGAVRRGRRAIGRGAARARDAASRTRVEPRVGMGFSPPRVSVESKSTSSGRKKIGSGDLSWERATSVPPGEGSKGGGRSFGGKDRKAHKRGVNQQGAFVGSYTHSGGQNYFGRGVSEGVAEGWAQEVPPWLAHRTDLQRAAARRRIAADQRPLFEAATQEEEAASLEALLVAEETERAETAQASTFAEPGEEAASAVTLRGSLAAGGVGAGLSFGGVTAELAGARERQDEAAEPSTAATLRDALAGRSDQRAGAEAREEVRQEGRQELGLRQEFAQEQRQELRFDTRVGVEQEAEQEVEQEVPTELIFDDDWETVVPRPRPDPDRNDWDLRAVRSEPFNLGRSADPRSLFAPDWVRETFATMATEGAIGAFAQDPGQAVLRDTAEKGLPLGVGLPVSLELYGSAEERRRFEDVQDLFLSGVSADGGGFSFDFGGEESSGDDGDGFGFGLDFSGFGGDS